MRTFRALFAVVTLWMGLAVVNDAQEKPVRRMNVPALVSAVAFSADGKSVTAWDPAGYSMWDIDGGRPKARDPILTKACGRMAVLPKSEDGATIGVSCKGRLLLFEVATGKAIGEWQLKDKQPAVLFTASSGGAFAAAVIAGATDTLEVSDRSGSAAKLALKAAQEIEQVTFAPRGGRVSAGSVEGVQVWDVPAGTPLQKVDGGPAHVFAPDGQSIAVVRGREVALVNLADAAVMRTLRGTASQVRWGADGRHVIGWTNQQVIVWNAATGSQILVLKADLFAAAAVSPDGSRLATVTTELRGEVAGSTIAVWNLPADAVTK